MVGFREMGVCLTKRYSCHDHSLFLPETGEESSYQGSLGKDSRKASTEVNDLRTYNVLLDERGAKVLESGSRRWQVVNVPGCTNRFELQELYQDDIVRMKNLSEHPVYKEEILGDVSFSSYLSGPLLNFSIDGQNLNTNSELSCMEALGYMKQQEHSITSPVVEGARTRPTAGDARLGLSPVENDWIPVVTVESSQHFSSEDAVKLKVVRRRRRDVFDGNRFKGAAMRETTSMSAERKDDLYRCAIEPDLQHKGGHSLFNGVAPNDIGLRQNSGEIGIFRAEKYFNSLQKEDISEEDGDVASQKTQGNLSASSPHTDVHDNSSFYGNSAAASSDLSFDSKTRSIGSKKHFTDGRIWSSIRFHESSRSDQKNRSIAASIVRSRVGCKWSACSGHDAVETEDVTVLNAGRASRAHELRSRSFPCPKNSAMSSPMVGGSEIGKGRRCSMQEPPLSPTARLANLLNLRRFGAHKSTGSSWTSRSSGTPKSTVEGSFAETRGHAVKRNNLQNSQDTMSYSGLLGSSCSVVGGGSPSASSRKSDSPPSILSLLSLRPQSPRRQATEFSYSSDNLRINNPLCKLSALSLKADTPKIEATGPEPKIPKMADSPVAKFHGISTQESYNPKGAKMEKKESPRWRFSAFLGKGESPRIFSLSSLQVKSSYSSPFRHDGSLPQQVPELNLLPNSNIIPRPTGRSICPTDLAEESCRGSRDPQLEAGGATLHGGLGSSVNSRCIKSPSDCVDPSAVTAESFLLHGESRVQNSGHLVGNHSLHALGKRSIIHEWSIPDKVGGAMLVDGSFGRVRRNDMLGKQHEQAETVELHGASGIDQRRQSFTFPSLASLPPSAIPLGDVTDARNGGNMSGSPSAPGSPAQADAFGSPFSVATCPSGDYRRRADLLTRLRLYSQDRVSSLNAGSSSTSSKRINGTAARMNADDEEEVGVNKRVPNDCGDSTREFGHEKKNVVARSSLMNAASIGDDYEYSDSSSDLFDLESLGGDGGFGSELPVFGQQNGYPSRGSDLDLDLEISNVDGISTSPSKPNQVGCCSLLTSSTKPEVGGEAEYQEWVMSEEGCGHWSITATSSDVEEEEEELRRR